MIKINLLPEELRKKELPVGRILRLVTYLLLALVLLYWIFSLAMVKFAENELEETRQNIRSLYVWQERYERDLVQNAEIAKRENLLKTKAGERMLWNQSLASLGNTTPFGTWLTGVSQNKSNPQLVTIKGKALRMNNLLEFISRLESDAQIARVDLVETQLGTAAGATGSATTMDFTLNVLKHGEGQ
ncbi:MAG TPA: PilN domain-containing protein [Candidatus Avacidaminococcus intestinavium]|uniref:PilN domain-containing protein n=1 Tax=Candidatus Avacidaminococcus intestinavium TaxID=2840684 RepID=A0A9D1SLT8_9FIRM|nr:PilN domain-containing protein [Candidatus Avacidaminococcus intestinavium]